MISILIPAYNSEKTIKRCLDSVLMQTVQDIEIIVINDGSRDSTLTILQEYAEKDKRIRIVNQPNRGVAVARNMALQDASGEYILYIDADDWIEPDMVQKMLTLAADADIVFCGHDYAETPNEVKHTAKIEVEEWNQQRQQLEFMKHKRMAGMLWNKLIRRNLTENVFFNEKTGYGEDAEFLWKILKRSRRMIVTNEILYHHVLEMSSISHLAFSEKNYSAIPMWEAINEEVERDYPELLSLARERLMSEAVYCGREMKKTGYQNDEHQKHILEIVRANIIAFLRSPRVSKRMKLYAVGICGGVLRKSNCNYSGL